MAKGLAFGDFDDDIYEDWDTLPYDSFLYTRYVAAEDTMFDFQAPYIYTFMAPVDNSPVEMGLLLQGAWDWYTTGPRWSRSQQVWRERTNNQVMVSKTKIRGTGRVLQLRFTSEPDKDFKLYGWGLVVGKNNES